MKKLFLIVLFLIFVSNASALNAVYTICSATSIGQCDYTCDGTDDQIEIQAVLDDIAAVNGGKLVFSEGVFTINADDPISPASNTEIEIPSGTTIQAAPNSNETYKIFYLNNVSNVYIHGGGIIKGEREAHVGYTGEHGHGINIYGSSENIRVEGLRVEDCWGDGIYINTTGKNLKIENVSLYNNRRNNLSIIQGDTIVINNIVTDYANGTAPQTGIDIEPTAGKECKNISVKGLVSKNNLGYGLVANANLGNITNLIIADSFITDVGLYGIHAVGNNLKNLNISGNVITGTNGGIRVDGTNVKVTDNIIYNLFSNSGIASVNSTNIMVQNNYLNEIGGPGMYINGVDFGMFSGNIVKYASRKTNNVYHGMVFDGGTNISLSNNYVFKDSTGNIQKFGILIYNTSETPTNYDLLYNYFYGNTANTYITPAIVNLKQLSVQ